MIEAHSRPPPANENRTKIVKFNKYLDLIKAGKGLNSYFGFVGMCSCLAGGEMS